MKTIQYKTGRDYGEPQVLEIWHEDTVSPDDLEWVSVNFVDLVRHIGGQVWVFGFDMADDRIGRAVLAEYDAGRYQPI